MKLNLWLFTLLSCIILSAVIVKYRDEKTQGSIELEDLLR